VALRVGVVGLLFLTSCAVCRDDWAPVGAPPGPIRGIASPGSVPGDLVEYESPEGPPAALVPSGTLEITIEEAVLSALENNRALRVERLNPQITRTFVEQEMAAFEPVLSAEVSAGREKLESREGVEIRDNATGGGAALSQYLPTGTNIEVGVTTDGTWGTSRPDQHATRAGLSVTQALLEGAGVAVNLAELRRARLDTLLSDYEFHGYVEALVAEVETTYWEYVLALRQIEIVEESLSLAEQQLEETHQRIRVGVLAETELAAAESEVALRRESLINARSAGEALRVRLLCLICPRALVTRLEEVIPRSDPVVPVIPLEPLENHVALALDMRPDLNQAEILVQKGELEIVKTKNGLLPRLDLFISLGKTGYASSFTDSVRDIGSDGYDGSLSLRFDRSLSNRGAKASHQRAVLTQQQLVESLGNLRDLVHQDVELAYIEVNRARQQVEATEITRRFQEEKLRAETVKFRVGKSTAILVAQAQRDLLVSQVAEVRSLVTYLKARIDLYLMEGSLLERRGLVAPGRQAATTEPEPSP
jgi:outer membrane protein